MSGHQRISVMDELNNYNPDTGEGDYILQVDLIDIDEKSEKELNILLNNPNAQGKWDWDALSDLLQDIDYKHAGLTEQDLEMIGIDSLIETPSSYSIADELDILYGRSREDKEDKREAQHQVQDDDDGKIAHMKGVKAQVKADALRKAEEHYAYVTLSFDSLKAKMAFMSKYGYDEGEMFIKGEVFAELIGSK